MVPIETEIAGIFDPQRNCYCRHNRSPRYLIQVCKKCYPSVTHIFSKLLNMNRLRMDMAEQVIINHVHLTLDPEHHHHQVLNHRQAL